MKYSEVTSNQGRLDAGFYMGEFLCSCGYAAKTQDELDDHRAAHPRHQPAEK